MIPNVYKMSTDSLEFSEDEILKEVKNLMCDEVIRPEPEYQFFSKFFATSRKEIFINDEEEILHLINSHGVQLRNDVKYWIVRSKLDNLSKDVQAPVLNPEHFRIEDFSDVIEILKEFPSEWTVIQVTKKFSLCDVTRKKEIPEICLTRFACGNLAERIHPYSVIIEDNGNSQENIFKILKNLAEMRKEFYNLHRTSSKNLSKVVYKTDSELESFIKELELHMLGPWISLFQGRLEDSGLEKETLAQVHKLLNSFCKEDELETMPNTKQIDLVYQLTLTAHLLKNKAIFDGLKKALYCGGQNLVNVSELMLLIENIKMLNLSNSCAIKRAKKGPVILILDNEVEMVPWEMIATLSGQPVCRISSLHLLYALYKYHEPHIKDGYRIIEIDSVYCLINPDQDLEECEKEMKYFLKTKIPWAEVEIAKAPDSKDLLSKIETYSTYLYCGHGSGTQYLKPKDLKKAFVKGLVLLFGCCSNIPKNRGGRTPHQNDTYTYISNGCPCIVGCIQDVGSNDADAACRELLLSIMPLFTVKETKTSVHLPKEPDVLKALASGRQACFRYWSKSAFVARGIPCKTAVGDVNIIQVSNFS